MFLLVFLTSVPLVMSIGVGKSILTLNPHAKPFIVRSKLRQKAELLNLLGGDIFLTQYARA